MKNKSILFILFLLIISCESNDKYSMYRQSFSDSYVTKKGAELKTSSPIDHLIIDADGNPIKAAYFATVEGEFSNVYDTIIQHGHCWSTTNPNPYINPEDTSTYSNLGAWNKDDGYFFKSQTSYLEQEQIYYIRSYIITSNQDTGYNQNVYCDTTIVPINEWYRTADAKGLEREGAVSFTMKGWNKDYECGYIGSGKNGNTFLDDFWEYDPVNETWSQIANLTVGRTEAIGFSITYTD